ncbi:unnamed protein product [Arabidopsis halleri]
MFELEFKFETNSTPRNQISMANTISRWRRKLRVVQSRRRQDLQIGERLLSYSISCKLR